MKNIIKALPYNMYKSIALQHV